METFSLDAAAVAKLLTEIGQRLELGGEISFKARAYYTAADNLLSLTTPLAELVAKGKLREIPGVGEAIAEKIIKLHKTGTHPTLEFLREQMPAGVLEMLVIPGLGPKKAALLYSELKVASLAELEEACKQGRLKDCKGFGEKFQAKMLGGIEAIRKRTGQWLIHNAAEHLRNAAENLKASHPELESIVPAGDLRRGCEIVGDPCLVALKSAAKKPERTKFNQDLSLITAGKDSYGVALLFATGSTAHLDELIALAKKGGFELSADGFSKKGKLVSCPEEKDVYAALKIPFIEPELREGRGEVQLAIDGKLPVLVEDKDLRGILHSHTDFSDGVEPLAKMAEACRERGYFYYGVADHSQSAVYAHGMKEEKVRAQHHLADSLNAKYGTRKFRIFKGVESDILRDGSLDYSAAILNDFDFVVASVHQRFALDEKAQTARIVEAVRNPRTTILGHLTGRLLLSRDSFPVDVDEVLKACAKHGVVVEINAHPYRLDLDWRWHQRAMDLGCMLSINPDAHDIKEIDLVHWGVVVARKGGVPKDRVLNCMELEQIAEFFKKQREK